ncbi:MAG TPA: hypothetical protein VEC14_16045 [Reyranellaceae bacterium]|nr:hypothetical protein [Reyranellaceae bacterium]
MKLSLTLLAVAGICLAAAAAEARDGRFERMDANHDGRVSLAEFDSFTSRKMMTGSGKAAAKFQQLNPQQRAKRIQRRFHRLDEGRKGYLTRDDFIAARKARKQGAL